MISLFTHVLDVAQGKTTFSKMRSSKWRAIRTLHLIRNPECALCQGIDKLNVHHIKPFHLYPELELEPSNLVTLCESKKHGANCHLLFGHLGNFSSYNTDVVIDTDTWRIKLLRRPNG